MPGMKKGLPRLLVFNYAMDPADSVFSHQFDVVNELSKDFQNLTVITSKIGRNIPSVKYKIINGNWNDARSILSLIHFIFLFLKEILLRKPDIIFSHMTEVQSAVTSPFTKIFGIKHYLWYAHTSKSIYLRFSSLFVDGILTSTYGSCPIQKSNTFIIGQSIKPQQFQFHNHTFQKNKINFIHVGRMDPSKEIEKIIDLVTNYNLNIAEASLTLVGKPTKRSLDANYPQKILSKIESSEFKINTLGNVERDKLSELFQNHDVFIHLFQGSLDKTLVEATFSGLPVVTVNKEYLRCFGTWGSLTVSQGDILTQMRECLKLSSNALEKELKRRRDIALQMHSFDKWMKNLTHILLNGELKI